MGKNRGRRRFTPEFYTDEELALMKQAETERRLTKEEVISKTLDNIQKSFLSQKSEILRSAADSENEEYGEQYGEQHGEQYGEQYGEQHGEQYGEQYGENEESADITDIIEFEDGNESERRAEDGGKDRNTGETIIEYNRVKAVEYAKKRAVNRNPFYNIYDDYGNDSMNFVSQAIHNGGMKMNDGWHFNSTDDRTVSWLNTEAFFNYVTMNEGEGIFGKETDTSQIEPGDVINLSFDGERFTHALFVIEANPPETVLVCAHSLDCESRPLDSYTWEKIRCIKILGYRRL